MAMFHLRDLFMSDHCILSENVKKETFETFNVSGYLLQSFLSFCLMPGVVSLINGYMQCFYTLTHQGLKAVGHSSA